MVGRLSNKLNVLGGVGGIGGRGEEIVEKASGFVFAPVLIFPGHVERGIRGANRRPSFDICLPSSPLLSHSFFFPSTRAVLSRSEV